MKIRRQDKVEKEEKVTGFYKGYEIRWLRQNPQHPDYKLVAEYDAKYGNK
jgi:hypothetical protein